MKIKKETTKGLIYGLSTFIMWGVFPIYFKLLENVGAVEILAHRIIWSFIILIILLRVKNRLSNLKIILRDKKIVLMLFLCGLLIATNWGTFIYAIETDRILQTSLGYFINPLLSILLGAIFLKEKFSLAAKFSVFLVFIAICIQVISMGELPLISIILPLSFAIYGLLHKKINVPSLEGLFVETMLIFPIGLAYLTYLGIKGDGSFDLNLNGILLIICGLVTIVPLITFNSAAIRLKLSTIGYMQYISPTLSMLIAVFLYNEELGISKIISFSLIWLGLFIISFDSIKRKKQ
ncbi:RarD protein [Campylobacter sputorum subsp. bubulus]|uniref:RarD protein n=1 Tax=Campylobacter sputorum subsp. sputorum TaxID=32024 RepID=A0A381DJT5_9BACT|nr:EamA family transporter RarD [Campylobacter sputorum]ASM34306.1 resistance permease RarD [Campylobacter sputorum aubsp. sputorum RM3237]KAB0582301.1 EamA family transporter RarD [Campylobacter sputorum subsp. sputorum]QEL04497.1 resistance permease RarD [Campylobacter sputorum subsp. sputorum]SUX09271.1 RarD protein [Campylobacter sputorum subsp. bubulus]SUX10962.1 RarD protein [Campylobacter sputorum subsp. sputorum]